MVNVCSKTEFFLKFRLLRDGLLLRGGQLDGLQVWFYLGLGRLDGLQVGLLAEFFEVPCNGT